MDDSSELSANFRKPLNTEKAERVKRKASIAMTDTLSRKADNVAVAQPVVPQRVSEKNLATCSPMAKDRQGRP